MRGLLFLVCAVTLATAVPTDGRTYSRELATGHARLVDVRLLRRFASDVDRPFLLDLSPDGSLVSVSWRGELGLLDLRSNTVRPIEPSRPAGGYDAHALFSPDGRRLLYRHWAALLLLDVTSGRTSELARTASWGDFAWLADGRIAFSDDGRLKLVRPGGRPHLVAGIPRMSRWAISSTGRRILYDRRCETFLFDRVTGRTRRLSKHMFVLPRSWSPSGTHFILQWAEECKPKTDALWTYHSYDVLYGARGHAIATLVGRGATWSSDSKLLFTYPQQTGTATYGLEALNAADLPGRRDSALVQEGNAYTEAFVGPGRWVVFSRYDRPNRVSHSETSGGLYIGRIAGR